MSSYSLTKSGIHATALENRNKSATFVIVMIEGEFLFMLNYTM